MSSTHFSEVCEYGQTHAQCRCPGPKAVRKIKCSTPERCQPTSETPAKESP